jgi:phospholipase/lecithinase/hemolysin
LHGETDVSVPVGNLVDHITELAMAGGRHFVLPNLFPLGSFPRFQGSIYEPIFNELSQDFNDLLVSEIQALVPQLGIHIYPVDFHGSVQLALNDPTMFGFTNVTDPAFDNGIFVPNPEDYLFWDNLHVTTRFHTYLGQQATIAVTSQTMPGDFNRDDLLNGMDVDALVAVIAAQTDRLPFDMNGDGRVNDADLTQWLAVAGAENLP